jgi:hypothetical protein
MAKTIFILGAGASKEAGAPLMNEFLDVARDLYSSGWIKKEEDKKAFEMVFKAINSLRISHYKSYIDLDNIEAVFGAFEMAKLLSGTANYTEKQINDLIASIKVVIAKTLELKMKYLLVGKNELHSPAYTEFAELILKLGNEGGRYFTSILTFNYDLGLDLALHNCGVRIDYCLPNDNDKGSFKLLKLHGSLNWGRCDRKECNLIIPLHLKRYLERFYENKWFTDDRLATLDVSAHLFNFSHFGCGGYLRGGPVIVPPTWNKTEYHSTLREVWAQAGRELADAENIIVVGYSHPISDSFFRYLFALGSVGDATIERFWVFDPAEGDEIERRYKELIGTGIDKRFQMFRKPFSEAVGIIGNELKKAG